MNLVSGNIGILIGYIIWSTILSSGCYSFRGITIPAEAQTFYVAELTNRAPSAPADIGQMFSETLKQKFLNQSRLNFTELGPDLSFSGEVTRFSVSSIAPQPGELSAFNRLDIAVKITYESSIDPEENWDNSFSFYQDFPRDQNFLDLQDQLIATIFQQLVEDIFNKAFTDW